MAPPAGPQRPAGLAGFGVVEPLRIFLTVGSQMPFDRLSAAVALWARSHAEGVQVVAQVGLTRLDIRALEGLIWHRMLTPADYRRQVDACDLLVAHAGMGSVLTALEHGRPLLVLPRRAHRRETRNDHQVDTALHLQRLNVCSGGLPVQVALEDEQIAGALDGLHLRWNERKWGLNGNGHAPLPASDGTPARSAAHERLIEHLRGLVAHRAPPTGSMAWPP